MFWEIGLQGKTFKYAMDRMYPSESHMLKSKPQCDGIGGRGSLGGNWVIRVEPSRMGFRFTSFFILDLFIYWASPVVEHGL